MRKPLEPTSDEWKSLYAAAGAFAAARPWTAMSDTDLFGVRDPETGITGYGCVMGQLGEYHALYLYLGGEGIAGYRAIRDTVDEGPDGSDPWTLGRVGRSQYCLAAEFLDAAEVPKGEKSLIKRLGLAFRGRHAWPSFRAIDPGLEPWPVSAWEARFLATALQQGLAMHARFVADPTVLTAPLDRDCVRVRVRQQQDGSIEWRDRVEPFETAAPEALPPVGADVRCRVEALRKVDFGVEVAYGFFPSLIRPRKDRRGSYPRMLMLVNADEGIILGNHLFAEDQFPGGFLAQFAQMLDDLGGIPRVLLVSDPWLHRALLAGFPSLAPNLLRVGRLAAAADAHASLRQFLDG